MLVAASDHGFRALERMARDRIVHPIAPGFALPVDLPEHPAARAAALHPHVPQHTAVSGLAALWVFHGGDRPGGLLLVGASGLHRSKPGAHARGWRRSFHSNDAAVAASTTLQGVRVVPPAMALADALRWEPLGPALAVAARLASLPNLRRECAAAVARLSERDSSAGRARRAWETVAAATDAGRRP